MLMESEKIYKYEEEKNFRMKTMKIAIPGEIR